MATQILTTHKLSCTDWFIPSVGIGTGGQREPGRPQYYSLKMLLIFIHAAQIAVYKPRAPGGSKFNMSKPPY